MKQRTEANTPRINKMKLRLAPKGVEDAPSICTAPRAKDALTGLVYAWLRSSQVLETRP
jgi:hypothetical protein